MNISHQFKQIFKNICINIYMQGTYVNDCRIQNAAVRLTSGDKIRFGYAGPAFSFTVIPSPGPPASAIQV
ncbi:FHA domain-containing protein, partial [Klebsiella pneumoniae]|nr:FHA domain-containing protein [Klebsiella pneumoniae]